MTKRSRSVRIRKAALLMIPLPFLAGCGASESSGVDAFSVSDSAGVLIATNPWVGEEALPEWRLEPEPYFSVGDPAPGPEYELYRIHMARQFSDGRVVVGMGGHEVRIYDPDGRHLVSLGRPGDGPGEISWIRDVLPLGDTAVQVLDPRRLAVHLFHASTGDWLGTHRHGLMLSNDNGVRPLADGSFVGLAMPTAGDPEERARRALVRFAPGGTAVDTLEHFTGELWEDNMIVSFRAAYWSAAAGDRVWAGSGDRLEIFRYDPEGRLRQIIRTEMPAEEVTDTLRMDVERDRRELQQFGMQQHIPTQLPVFGRLMGTPDGWLLVRRYMSNVEQRRSESRIWDIYDPDGRHVAFIRFPLDSGILEIGDDYLLGSFPSVLDIETLRKYRFVKPPGF